MPELWDSARGRDTDDRGDHELSFDVSLTDIVLIFGSGMAVGYVLNDALKRLASIARQHGWE